MAGASTDWRQLHPVGRHELTSTSHRQACMVSSSSGSTERHAFGGWQPRSVRQRLSVQRLSEQRLSEQCRRLSLGLLPPSPHALRQTGRYSGDVVTSGAAIARHAASEHSALPSHGERESACLPRMHCVRQGSCAWDTATQSWKLCMSCSELASVMMVVESCMSHGS